eukprot:TRINITY_DN121_c0_g1_i1.p1 TRINITY_DN121_c0_g1~~TRINITY_DN121_c0_g1_i1.p1  ORF type:complete len:349 (+),score=97.74 TRINITY_DN121_c0_g1_i1:209-1255(+)
MSVNKDLLPTLKSKYPNVDFSDLEDSRLDVVQLDSLVIMKIIKHCKENLPELVNGQLLGLDIGRTLEVTNCFPFPNRGADDEEVAEEESAAEYQIAMMRCLREVNVDNNTVGWYQSTYLGSFLNESMIDTQYKYQVAIPKCVVVIYDPLRTAHGALSLKAFRLTEAFMELYKNQDFTVESLRKSNVSFQDIFEEVPIQLRNSNLSNAALYELEDSPLWDPKANIFDSLDLSTNPFLEKNLEFLIEYIDDLSVEQNRFQYYQRNVQRQQAQLALWLQKRRAENIQRRANGEEELPEEESPSVNPLFKPIEQPSRLESLLITNQINNYCQQVNQFAGQSFGKLFLLDGLK